MATGIVQAAWDPQRATPASPNATPYLDWAKFAAAGRGLFLWEAFVTADGKAATHVDDATVAVAAFRDCLPDPTAMNAVTAERHCRCSALRCFGAAGAVMALGEAGSGAYLVIEIDLKDVRGSG